MTEDREHVVDELAAYTLGSLERGEHVRVEAHVAICEQCARVLTEYRAVVGSLPQALEPVAPPSGAWEAIRSAARLRRTPPPVWKRLLASGGWYRTSRWATAAAVAVSLLTWNLSLQRELGRYAEGPQVEKLARRPARLVILAGAGQSNANARIFAAVDGQSGHMAIAGLRPLESGRVYQLWFVPGGGRAIPAATFAVRQEGRAWVVIRVPISLDETRAVIVTEEPAPGSASPSGAPLLEARHWR